MNQKIKKWGMILAVACWMTLSLGALLLPDSSYSESERRELAGKPDPGLKEIVSGDFMKDFEAYSLDQFPLRDTFRSLKALVHYNIFQEKDNNGFYFYKGHAVKMEYPYKEASVNHALKRFCYLYDTYLLDTKGAITFAVVPDKGVYAGRESGHLQMDYDRLLSDIQEGLPWADVVDLRDTLSLSDYYRTDPHWKQEKLFHAAEKIADSLKTEAPKQGDYEKEELSEPFFGSFKGQAALPLKADRITLLQNEILKGCTVYDYESQTTGGVYDLNKLSGKDTYEVYLKGARALLTITNPKGTKGRELLVFRDSFGSSLVPLLIGEYEKVTLVDIRYIRSDLLKEYLEIKNPDVLFLYSTTVLNNSETLK